MRPLAIFRHDASDMMWRAEKTVATIPVATGSEEDVLKRLAIVCVLVLATPAHAEKIDLSTTTCQQFLDDDDGMKTTLAWLDGYYKDENDPPVIDSNKLVENAKKLGTFCRKNPTLGLITAADKIYGK